MTTNETATKYLSHTTGSLQLTLSTARSKKLLTPPDLPIKVTDPTDVGSTVFYTTV